MLVQMYCFGIHGPHLSILTRIQWQQFTGGEDGYLLVTDTQTWISCLLYCVVCRPVASSTTVWSAFQTLVQQCAHHSARKISFLYSTLLFAGFSLIVVWCMFF